MQLPKRCESKPVMCETSCQMRRVAKETRAVPIDRESQTHSPIAGLMPHRSGGHLTDETQADAGAPVHRPSSHNPKAGNPGSQYRESPDPQGTAKDGSNPLELGPDG